MPRQTFHATTGQVPMAWRHIDASGLVLGRLATEVATVLMGKHRPEYTPNVQCGDAVIITNASKIVLTGRKAEQKTLRRWSGYPGGLRVQTYETLLASNPERLVTEAIIRMIPRGRLGRKIICNLRVFAGAEHTHAQNNPIPFDTRPLPLKITAANKA
ncbi:MAG: 50S ribosomal protein L13 [Phycisphaerales bacterium]|nr:50S ribosomal protein L13 [Phycisphaerales bacterium]